MNTEQNVEGLNVSPAIAKPMLCAVNHFSPSSPDWLLSKYKGLREPDENRDNNFSPLHDGIMTAIQNNLLEHNKEQFREVWSNSMFPERLTKEILRLVELQIQRGV